MPTNTLAQLATAVANQIEPKPTEVAGRKEFGSAVDVFSPQGMWIFHTFPTLEHRLAMKLDDPRFIAAVKDWLWERNWIVSISIIPPVQENPPHPHVMDRRGKVIVRVYQPDANMIEVPSVEIEVWMSRKESEATALLRAVVAAFEIEVK